MRHLSFRVKMWLGNLLLVIGFLGALYGLERIAVRVQAGQSGKSAMIFLLIAVFIGMYGGIVARYNRARYKNDNTADRLALEAFAKLGSQAGQQRPTTKNQK